MSTPKKALKLLKKSHPNAGNEDDSSSDNEMHTDGLVDTTDDENDKNQQQRFQNKINETETDELVDTDDENDKKQPKDTKGKALNLNQEKNVVEKMKGEASQEESDVADNKPSANFKEKDNQSNQSSPSKKIREERKRKLPQATPSFSSSSNAASSYYNKGFSFNGSAKEQHGHPIYCVSWSSDLYVSTTEHKTTPTPTPNNNKNNKNKPSKQQQGDDKALYRCFATCAGNNVTIYEVDRKGRGNIKMRQAYKDADTEEVFYSCAFGGRGAPSSTHYISPLPTSSDSSEESFLSAVSLPLTLTNPIGWTTSASSSQLLCCGGTRGIIKVIDPRRRSLIMTLSGHGDEIYDLRFSPMDEFLLITASKDESLRLWNLRSATCVVIFAGHEGHRDAVLSTSFHPLGHLFVSGGMDTSIKIWSLEEPSVVKAIEESNLPSTSSLTATKSFYTRYQQMPLYSTNKAHTDYVDCVQFVGDLILSKSITNTILLWKPDMSQARSFSNIVRPPRSADIIPLREFTISKCEVWFIRFQTDEDCRMVSIGNTVGVIKVWDIGLGKGTVESLDNILVEDKEKSPDGSEGTSTEGASSSNHNSSGNGGGVVNVSMSEGFQTKKCLASLTHKECQGKTIRMVTFSPDGNSLIACCDDSSILMWKAMTSSSASDAVTSFSSSASSTTSSIG